MSPPVYLDYAATTPVDPAVAQAMMQCLGAGGAFANPSSVHGPGRAAAALIEQARAQVAALIGAEPQEIVFTSGATESNNLAVLGVARANADRGRHIVTSRIEHKALLDPCRRLEKEGSRITYLAPDRSGRIDPAAVRDALRRDTQLVSIMHVNNEIGVIEDIAEIGAICRAEGIAFHTDAAQSVGRIEVDVGDLPIDFLSLTSHKIYGPKGVGALYVRRGARALLQPQSFGGGQEGGLRPGTLPTHQIVGFGVAAEQAAAQRQADHPRMGVLRDRLWAGIERLGGVHLNGEAAPRVPHILNVSFEDVEGESLIMALSSLAVSTGAACSSATGDPSYVLRALGRSTRLAESSLRFSLGRFTTADEIDHAAEEVRRQVARLRGASPGEGRLDSPAGGLMEGSAVVAGLGAAPAGDSCGTDVERLFRELPAGGAIPDSAGTVLRGEAGGPAEEVWVRFHLLVEGDIVKDARFEARGCPHTLATAAWLASGMPGRRCDDALRSGPRAWARALGVPVEKLGRLLVIEDALRASLRSGPGRGHHE
jgi:cysteine desulfurase